LSESAASSSILVGGRVSRHHRNSAGEDRVRRTALVIGGSVGGLFAAHLLQGADWNVTVFERAAGDLGDRGTGIGTRDDLFAVMRRIGLAADASIGVEVRGRIGLARDGAVLHDWPVRAVTNAWWRIWRPLRQALPDSRYRDGMTLTGIEQADERVTAIFADRSRAEGDLLVAADGLHSTVRSALLPDLRPRYAGYVAWRGVVDEHRIADRQRDMLLHHMAFGFPDGELMLSIPMPGPQDGPHAGERRCHFVWFRLATENHLLELCTDKSGRQHGMSIPPPLIRPELLAAIKRDADELIAPQLAALVHGTAQIILQPIFDLESPRITFGRVALLGDAAFVARPHVASGVMKAAIDAETLTDALAANDDVAAALACYEAERQPYGAWLVERGRHIGGYFAEAGGNPRARIETLMHEYGSAGLVRDQPIAARGPG
jgi:2-polyprenyl-6-methoxyphenol hydroxylase-like FAD-dependent oxidoreductase